MLTATAFLLLAAAAAAPPLLTREPDGSVVLHRAIHADQPPLARVTRGLLDGPCPARRGCAAGAARGPRRDPAERAFEEAVDQARQAPGRP